MADAGSHGGDSDGDGDDDELLREWSKRLVKWVLAPGRRAGMQQRPLGRRVLRDLVSEQRRPTCLPARAHRVGCCSGCCNLPTPVCLLPRPARQGGED